MEEVKQLRAIIIDDEERAVNSLKSLLNLYVPEVEVVGTAHNVPEGVLLINKEMPQLVFLDIEMPEYNGFELLNFFKKIDFEIVFVTAYNEYALRAFEASAVDYLLKPVDIDKLKIAVEKVKKQVDNQDMQLRIEMLKDGLGGRLFTKIALPMADGMLFKDTCEIVSLEADGAYTLVFMQDGSKIMVSKKLKFFEDILSNNPTFYRCHRSFMVNINHIVKYSKAENLILLDDGKAIQIARDRKTDFENLLKENQISFQ